MFNDCLRKTKLTFYYSSIFISFQSFNLQIYFFVLQLFCSSRSSRIVQKIKRNQIYEIFNFFNCSHEFRKQVMEKKYEAINPALIEKAVTENLETLLQKVDKCNHDIKSMKAMSSRIIMRYHALLHGKKEFAPLAKEENSDEFL